MAKYFRITAYYPKDDFCFIMDSNGMFDKLWQFSSFLVKKGLKIIEAGDDEKFLDISISKAEESTKEMFLRATAEGQPTYKEITVNGTKQKAIIVGEKSYVPNKN